MLLSTMQWAESEAKSRLLLLRQEIANLEWIKNGEYWAIADTRKWKTQVYNEKQSISQQLDVISSILEETKKIRKEMKENVNKDSIKHSETINKLDNIIKEKEIELNKYNNIDLEKKLKEDMRLKEEIDKKILQISIINNEIKKYEDMKKNFTEEKELFSENIEKEYEYIEKTKDSLQRRQTRLELKEKRILSLKK